MHIYIRMYYMCMYILNMTAVVSAFPPRNDFHTFLHVIMICIHFVNLQHLCIAIYFIEQVSLAIIEGRVSEMDRQTRQMLCHYSIFHQKWVHIHMYVDMYLDHMYV